MRWLVVLAAINVLLALGVALPERTTIHPVAPPLTRVGGNGLDTIVSGAPMGSGVLRNAVAAVIRATGSPEQQAAARGLDGPPADTRRADELRAAIQADTIAMITLLGPDRVEPMLRARPALSAAYGEVQVWEALSR